MTGAVKKEPTTLPHRRYAERIDGCDIIAVEGIADAKGAGTLRSVQRVLLDDDRILYGCTSCDGVGLSVTSVIAHQKAHSFRYSETGQAVVQEALARAQQAGQVVSQHKPAAVPRTSARPTPASVPKRAVAAVPDVPAPAARTPIGPKRGVVEIAQDIVGAQAELDAAQARIDTLTAEMSAAIARPA